MGYGIINFNLGYFLVTELTRTLQTHHTYSTLKRRENGRFHVVSTWNIRGVFVGKYSLLHLR